MITYYVNTASSAGGNGTTNATSGANRAWASLLAAETALRGGGAADDIQILCCGVADDVDPVTFAAGGYVAVGKSLSVKGNPGDPAGMHRGVFDSNRYKLRAAGVGGYIVQFLTATDIIIFDGLQICATGAAASCFYVHSNLAAGSAIRNCLLVGEVATTNGMYIDAAAPSLVVENCVIWGGSTPTANYGIYCGSTGVSVYNCAVMGFGSGYREVVAFPLRNCSAHQCGTEYFGCSDVDHCASTAGTGTNPVAVSSWGTQFMNPGYDTAVDLRLRKTSLMIAAGLDHGTDPLVPLKDIAGVTRSLTAPTIGPFEGSYSRSKPAGLDYRFAKTDPVYGLVDAGDGDHSIQVGP